MTWALFLAKAGSFAQKYWKVLVGVGLLALILALTYCAGGRKEVNRQQARTIEMQQKVGAANEKASERRVEDAIRAEEQKRELNDAIQDATSSDDSRRRTGCAIMRQQGRDVSAIAACRGS